MQFKSKELKESRIANKDKFGSPKETVSTSYSTQQPMDKNFYYVEAVEGSISLSQTNKKSLNP